eukprot:1175832-Prorocentrum_minimum.AAC.4
MLGFSVLATALGCTVVCSAWGDTLTTCRYSGRVRGGGDAQRGAEGERNGRAGGGGGGGGVGWPRARTGGSHVPSTLRGGSEGNTHFDAYAEQGNLAVSQGAL